MKIIGTHTLLAYADDIILLGESKHDIENRATKLIKSSKNMRLVVNEHKTKYMMITRNATAKNNLRVGGLTFELIGNFKYLGVHIDEKNSMHNEVRLIINAAKRCYFIIKGMFSSKLLSKHTKKRLYYTCMRSIVMYACETWFIESSGIPAVFFGITKKLTEKHKTRTMIIKDSTKVLITKRKKIAKVIKN